MMQDLAESGAPDLEAIRARLFSFEDILLLTQKARVTLFDGLSTELVTMCLREAPAPMVEAVLSSIGARARRMIESELGQGSDGIAMADIVKARKSIASTAIKMAREGAFELPTTQNAA
jgi:flagellar motor switch protein FliG